VYVPEKKSSFVNITVDDSYNIEISIFYMIPCTRWAF